MTAPTPDAVETLAEVEASARRGVTARVNDTDRTVATAVLAAIDSGQVPGVGRVEAVKADALGAVVAAVRGQSPAEYRDECGSNRAHWESAVASVLAAAPAPQQVDTEAERAAVSALRAAIQSEIDSAYRVGANYVLCSRLRSALSTSTSGVVAPAAEPVALTEEQRNALACTCHESICPLHNEASDGYVEHSADELLAKVERILRDRLAATRFATEGGGA